jgi:hypothetical protein
VSDAAVIRDCRPSDLPAIRKIHEATQIDYAFPDLTSPLWIVTKVVEVDGVVRVAAGMYVQAETYLWLDKSDWGDAEQKMVAIKALDKEVMQSTWLKGVECAVLWLPPGMERFGKRLTQDLGFTRDRDGWVSYSKMTNCHTEMR